jgi:hypothetical protein
MIFPTIAVFALLAIGIGQAAGADPASNSPARPLPPLKVDKDAPLLLDHPDTAVPGSTKGTPPTGPTPVLICYDCHGNYREESLAVVHARKEVTCVVCHGESEAHASDEDNTTAPQVLYPRQKIAAKCAECHKTHDAPAVAIIGRWQERGLQKTPVKSLVCTDCHGAHRLRVRTVHWDKETGKLMPATKDPEPHLTQPNR